MQRRPARPANASKKIAAATAASGPAISPPDSAALASALDGIAPSDEAQADILRRVFQSINAGSTTAAKDSTPKR